MRGSVDTSVWKNINPEDPDAEGNAHTRLSWLMREDPFAAMLSVQVRDALPSALYFQLFREDGTFWEYSSVNTWDRNIRERIERIPYAGLWTAEFKEHIIHLAVRAIMPEGNK